MIRPIRIAVLIAAGAVIVSSCASASIAADVDGSLITDDEVTGVRNQPSGPVVQGDQFRNDLTTLIVAQATLNAAEEDYGITGLDEPAAREAWLAQATEQELSVIGSVASNGDLTDAAVDIVTTQLMVRSAVIGAMVEDPEVLRRIWDEEQVSLVDVCARHILVATEEEATAAHSRVLEGEDFSAVADELSLDAAPEGALPCPSSPSSYVEPFATVVATIPVGEVSEPFETEFGWHVALVESREGPTSYEDFAQDPLRWASDTAFAGVWATWSDDALKRADVTVRSPIGQWFASGDGVLPPPASP